MMKKQVKTQHDFYGGHWNEDTRTYPVPGPMSEFPNYSIPRELEYLEQRSRERRLHLVPEATQMPKRRPNMLLQNIAYMAVIVAFFSGWVLI
jgi:hypothetical protein